MCILPRLARRRMMYNFHTPISHYCRHSLPNTWSTVGCTACTLPSLSSSCPCTQGTAFVICSFGMRIRTASIDHHSNSTLFGKCGTLRYYNSCYKTQRKDGTQLTVWSVLFSWWWCLWYCPKQCWGSILEDTISTLDGCSTPSREGGSSSRRM